MPPGICPGCLFFNISTFFTWLNPLLMTKSSAMPYQIKRASLSQFHFLSTRKEHISELGQPLVPLSSVCTYPLNPQCEAVRNIICTVGRVTGAGEQVLVAICLLSIEIGVYAASTDTEGCVKEGNVVLGGAGAAVRVIVTRFLRMFHCEFYGTFDLVYVPMETVKLSVWPEPDHEYVIQEPLVAHHWADTIHRVLLGGLDDVNIEVTHEDIHNIWRRQVPIAVPISCRNS